MQDANGLIHSCPFETYGTSKNKYAVANDSDHLDLQSYNTMDLMIIFYIVFGGYVSQGYSIRMYMGGGGGWNAHNFRPPPPPMIFFHVNPQFFHLDPLPP